MWIEKDNQLVRDFEFRDFKQAFAFMEKVGEAAETMGHHPDWSNSYNKVSIRLSTHEADNTVTEKDRQLAAQIDRILASFS